MAIMAGEPVVEKNKEELSVCMPSSFFLEGVEPPPQSVADV